MAHGQIRSLLKNGETDPEAIRYRARQILAYKYWSGLNLEPTGRQADNQKSNQAGEKAFLRDLYGHSLTLLINRDRSIPITELGKKRIACITLNQDPETACTAFRDMAGKYTRMDYFSWAHEDDAEAAEALLENLQSYDIVLAAIYQTGQGMDAILSTLSDRVQLISVFFGNPYAVEEVEGLQSYDALVLAYQQNIYTEELAAQLIFGGSGAQGRLPVRINDEFLSGQGILTTGNLRLQYAYPENAGISSERLNRKIDSIVLRALEAGAFPGCEVIAARKGMVIFHKTYGHHTFDKRIEVRPEDLYDLASVTKVSGPLSGLMLLESMGMFSHLDRLGDYTPSMKGSDKADLGLREILAHQAGLYPYLLYWKNTIKKNGNYKRRFIRDVPSEKYPIRVADRIYLKHDFRKKVYKAIRKSAIGEKEYKYSGLSFLIYPEIIENLSGGRYEDFLSERIYHPLGAWNIVFNPYRFHPLSRIAPTEVDSLFRRQLVHGYVHDEAAAVMGGYSGNAGLFATANDLLKLFEMYRRMGNYGGEQILAADVMKQYTRYQFPENENRRGLGFDKPSLGERDGTKDDYPCPGASPSSFGHSGFTGTFAWADPEHAITYVFLSNRVYPTRDNNLVGTMNIRTAILQSIYDSIIE
jgi:CubicO group peptidase (beta-lactamase class C family)